MKSIGMIVFMFASTAMAGVSVPPCLDDSGKPIPVNNAQVIQWKSTTKNQFLARAHAQGVVTDIYPNENGHNHFGIDLDSNPKDGLEVVYNQSFGALPTIRVGMNVEVCGDYITSDAATSQYPESPMEAIIHWIHRSDSPKHQSGFLIIDGVLYGQGNGNGS